MLFLLILYLGKGFPSSRIFWMMENQITILNFFPLKGKKFMSDLAHFLEDGNKVKNLLRLSHF